MGLLDFLSGSSAEQGSHEGTGSDHTDIIKGQSSNFPLVYIKRLKPHVNGTRLQLYCQIVNSWSQEIELDKVRIFNTTRELDTSLRAHEEREFLIYDGPTLSREDHEAQLDYKTREKGDYFQTVHMMTFAYRDSDKTYLPSDIHVDGAVRDIFG